MSESTTRQIVLAAQPHGRPQADDFRLEQAAMPATPPGGVLLRVLYLSLDPYMRGRMDEGKSYAKPVEIGEVMSGEGVAEVISSDHPSYAKGDLSMPLFDTEDVQMALLGAADAVVAGKPHPNATFTGK